MTQERPLSNSDVRPTKNKKRSLKNTNPLQSSIWVFISSYIPGTTWEALTSKDVPKRYTRYGSLLLLSPTFVSHPSAWSRLYASLTAEERAKLFQTIVQHFSDGAITHIAMNAPISLTTDESLVTCPAIEQENLMRSPAGLMPLYGNFGPAQLTVDTRPDSTKVTQPSIADFEIAYWTQTSQLHNIVQVWAPRWTMFSRGNISEKSRILQDGTNSSQFSGLTERDLGEDLGKADVVDFYVGIGYFAFCYLRRGVKRVWGWDINGWSIEGLRRGCVVNGWAVKIIRIGGDGGFEGGRSIPELVEEIERLDGTEHAVRCVGFLGDNKWVGKVTKQIQETMRSRGDASTLNVRHCNLGLLPSSRDSWNGAWSVLDPDRGGWLHVHENVEVTEIDNQGEVIVREFERLIQEERQESWTISCEHIERVKTYAPGVMHCVYDIKLYPSR